MKIVCDVSVSGRSPRSQGSFSPLSLLPSGSAGVWFDPTDRLTLFQDSAGTVPVTGFGQPVGRILDRGPNALHAVQGNANARPTYAAGVLGLGCLVFDGVDDFLTTLPLNMTGVSVINLCVGQRKTSDSGIGTILSLGTSTSLPGSLQNFAPRSAANYGWRGFTTATAAIDVNSLNFPAPDAAVLSGTWAPAAAAGAQIIGRRNGLEVARGGSGLASTFQSLPLTLGMRNPDLPYRGEFYGLWLGGLGLTVAQQRGLEQWMARKIGVTV